MASLFQSIGPDPFAALPRYSDVANPQQPQGSTTRNPLVAGVSSGIDQLQATGGAFAAAIGNLIGAKGLQDWGTGVYQRNSAEASANGRSDLDKPIWDTSLSELPAWIGYKTAQQIPQWAAQIGGGAVLGRGMRAANLALPEAAAELGARAPAALGGGGAGFGAIGPLTKEALHTGREYATDVAGAALAGYPIGVGSMYQEAIDRGDPNRSDAARAVILGPAYAALDAIEPAQLKGLLTRGQKGGLATRMLTSAFAGAAAEMPQEAVQTAMEQSFRPDLSPMDKFKNIVDAAVTGGVVGGFAGGVGGIRRAKSPTEITNDDLKNDIDQGLAQAKGAAVQPAPALTLTPGLEKQPNGDITEPAPARPFGKEPLERMQGMLADVESRMMNGGSNQQDAVNRQALRAELAQRTAEQQSRPFAQVSDSDLNTALQAATTQQQDGMVNAVQQEIAARQAEAQAMQQAAKVGPNQPAPRQFETPVIPGFENLPNQGMPAAEFAAQQQRQAIQDQNTAQAQMAKAQTVAEVHQNLADMAGIKSPPKAFSKAGIQTQEDGLAFVKERLDQGNAPKWAVEAGKKIGLLDSEGKDQTIADVQKQIADNTSRMQDLYDKFGLTQSKQFSVQISKLQEQNATLRQQSELMRKAEDRAQERDRERNPPDSLPPGPMQFRAPNGIYTEVTVLDKKPIEQNGQKYQPVTNSKGIEYNIPINALHPSAPSNVESTATSPAPAQTEAARSPLPIQREPSGGPIPNNLKSPLWQNNPVAQREGMTPLRGEGEAAAAIGQSSEIAPKSVSAAPAPLTGEETMVAARDISRYEPVLSEIVSNKKLPVDMRRGAREARDQLRTGTGYQEKLDNVLSDYSAHTGDYQYSTETFGKNQNNLQAPNYGKAVDQALDRRGVFSSEQRAQMRDQAVKMLEQDAQNFANNPEGPFKGAQSNVVTSANVDPRYGGYLKDLMHSLGMGNIRVFMFHPSDVSGNEANYGLHGPFNSATTAERRGGAGGVAPFGIGNKDFYMALRPGMTPEQTVETIAHELGHMVWHTSVANASAEVKSALKADYLKWKAQTENKSAQDMVKSLRNRYTAAATIQNMEERLRSQKIPNADEYWLSEHEWFADGVSRWATTSAKPLTVVDKFFSKVAGMMKAIVKYVTGQGYMPPQSIKQFMDNMGSQSSPLDWEGFQGKYSLLTDSQAQAAPTIDNMLDRVGKVSPQGLMDRMKMIIDSSDGVLGKLQNIPWKEASNQINKFHLYATTVNHIVDFFGPLFKPGTLEAYRAVQEEQRANFNRMAQIAHIPYQMWERMNAANPKAGEGIGKLMGYTLSKIDPRKDWDAHEHLKGSWNEAALKQSVAQANQLYREMGRIVVDGQRASTIYDTFAKHSELDRYSAQTVALFNLIQANAAIDETFKASNVGPMKTFMADHRLYGDMDSAHKYWRDARDALVNSIGDYVKAQQGRLSQATQGERNKFKSDTGSLLGLLQTIAQQDTAMSQAPYFHLGRFGDYYASFRMVTDKNGTIDPKVLDRIGKLIDQGKFSLSIPLESVKDRVFARFETADEQARFEKLMMQMEKEGLLTREPREGQKQGQEPKLGQRGETPISKEPSWAQSLVSSLKNHFEESSLLDDMTPEQVEERKKMVAEYANHIDQFFENMIPDASILKVNMMREGIPGFTPDMIRSYAFRSSLGAEALAGVYASPKLSNALKEIRAQVDNAKVLGATDQKTRLTMQNTLFELLKRESNRTVMNRNSFFDAWRAVNHNYFLGLSPSFVLTQMVQLPQYLWPTLASKHGYVKSADAIRSVTPTAFRILRATMADGYKGSWKQALDATINSDVLDKAKVSASDKEFILKMANSGLLDMGSQSRELGRVVEGRRDTGFDVSMRVASSFGFYSEMVGRLISALAAKKLYTGPADGLENYARGMVSRSMFEFSNWNTSRLMSRHGPLGAFTPVATAFMSYTQQVLETLTREIHNAYVNKAATPTQKSEARRFLAAHMAAMAFFAGSLGMPGASMVATVINKMADLFRDKDEEPFDVRLAYQHFLATVFGQGVGAVLSKGVPRAIGFDISSRTGEQDILPFSRLLSDRRQWKDAFPDYISSLGGSPVSMVGNLIGGATAIGNGDLINGAKQFMPQAIKGGIEAYRMTTRGYEDAQGRLLPMEPGALDIMYQLLGLMPGDRANYDELSRDYQANKGQMMSRAGRYRKWLAQAIEDGDTEKASGLIADIKRFDQMNPAYAVLPNIGQVVASRARARAQAGAFNTPVGVPARLRDEYSFGPLQ